MSIKRNNPFLVFCFFLGLFSCVETPHEKEMDASLLLWYDEPASIWTEALPVGNGRLGAMVYGGTEKEVIQFNEETVWTGQPHDYAHPGAHKVLSELRQLIWEGKQSEAQTLANEKFMSQPLRQLSYQPFGSIFLDFPDQDQVKNYRRQLNLENATSTVSYEIEGIQYKREVYASHPQQAIIVNIEASESGKLNFNIGLDSPHSRYEVRVEGDQLILKGRANNYPKNLGPGKQPYPKSKIIFEARLKVINEGGELIKEGNMIKVSYATNVTLQLVAATNFVNYSDLSGDPTLRCRKYLSELEGISIDQIKRDHVVDHQEFFNRVKIDLGKSEISNRPTDERLRSFQSDLDLNLVSLLYQYGRYLLIASSRKGSQAANLQGIWNDKLDPSWDSKYTININTEMNYWLSEMTNLSELTEPLISLIKDLSISGQNVAKEHYDLEGWVAHHNTDLWRGAAPINNSNHGIWPTGGAWLSQHLWWHYQYTNDKDFLSSTAYPILKGASKFFIEYLVSDPKHPEWLVSGPSNSPENGGLVMAPTMDHQIIRNLFSNTIEAAEILELDADFIKTVKEKKSKIAPNLVGQHGQLQEWLVDQDDPTNKHRHVSHLWGLHPGNEIHPLTTPDLAEAARVTLSHRGDGGTGWSRAWKINFWARLLDGDHAFVLLKNLMVPSRIQGVDMNDKGGLYVNLFDAHPPFQIDGNFGATSGVTEMLLQSHLRDQNGDYFQDILPALPSNFSAGKLTGIKGRGGFEISLEWENGDLLSLEVKSLAGNKLNLRYEGKSISRETKKGETMLFKASDFI